MPRVLIIVISLVLSLILGVLLLWPKYQNLTNLQIQLENKKTEFKYRDEYYQDLFLLSEKLKEFEAEISNIDSALPPDSSSAILSFYNYLQRVPSESGLILKNLGSASLSPLDGKPGIEAISISITVSGSYPSLKNFLKTLEKSARIIKVESISFSSPTEEEFFEFGLGLQTHSY